MKNEEGLNHAKISEHSGKIFSEFAMVLMSKERSKEMTCGAIVAAANLLVIMIYTLIKDKDRAMEVLTTVLSKAIKDYETKQTQEEGVKVIVCEISLDPETFGK